jgi:hypothetical protein
LIIHLQNGSYAVRVLCLTKFIIKFNRFCSLFSLLIRLFLVL